MGILFVKKIQFIIADTLCWIFISRAHDCNALYTNVSEKVVDTLQIFQQEDDRSHTISSFPLTQHVSVISLRYWCNHSGASLPSHSRVQHRHHCHSSAGSSGQSWEQAGSSHTSRPVFYQLQQPGKWKKEIEGKKHIFMNTFSSDMPLREEDEHRLRNNNEGVHKFLFHLHEQKHRSYSKLSTDCGL